MVTFMHVAIFEANIKDSYIMICCQLTAFDLRYKLRWL